MSVQRWEPRQYQRHSVKQLLAHPHHGLLIEPGLGKTSITLEALRLLRKGGLVDRALVVAPLRVCHEVWPRELKKWAQFQALQYRILHGSSKTLDDADGVDVFLINPEGLGWLASVLSKRRHWPFDWLIVDESTKFKHTNTSRFKLLRNLLPHFTRRTILTGTPTPNGLLDLFGQVYLIDSGRALGRFITHYRNEFFYPSGYGGYTWTPQQDAEQRILERVRPITTTLLAKDWLELPERIDNVIRVKLPDSARQVYAQMEQELIARLERGDIVAANAAVATAKCRQVANGGVYDDARNVHQLHEAKVDAIESIVDELQGSPLLVLYHYEHDLERLRKRFPQAVALHGGQSTRATKEAINAWNAGAPLLLAQAETVYHGLNLQEGAGHTVAWFGITWDFEVYDQAVKRIWRSGQKSRRVVVHHVLAEATIDELMFDVVVGGKQASQRRVLEALKTGLSKRR